MHRPMLPRSVRPRIGRTGLAAAAAATLVATLALSTSPAYAADTNIALGAVATATSVENAGLGPDRAVDGDVTTRWSSAFADPQTITLDLGAAAHVTGVTLRWEAAYGSAYTVQGSTDGTAWTDLYATTSGDGGIDAITGLDATARYLRMTGTARATPYGYSLYEFEAYGAFTQRAVSVGVPSANLPEDGTLGVPVRLNTPSDTPVTVRYSTVDGTAVAGTDYTAASGTLTFNSGETVKTVTLSGVPDTVHEPSRTFGLKLSDPSPPDVLVSPRGDITVTVLDNDPVPFDGGTLTIDAFDSGGMPAGMFTFGSDADDNPTITFPPAGERPGADAGNLAMRLDYNVSGWGGFTHDLSQSQDWTAFDGFSFWVKGTGSGQTIEYEIKDGSGGASTAELWNAYFTDTTAGWRKIQTPFKDFKRRADYQPGGAPDDGRLDLTSMWGYAVNLPQNSGTLVFDQVEAYQQVLTVDRFEGEVPFAAPPRAGIFTFGSDADDNPTLSLAAMERPGAPAGNRVLHGTYDISGWGGFVHDISYNTEPQDWSAFKGFRFWWYGRNPVPLPPGAGPRIYLEIKDGGDNAEASELWNTSFTDDFSGWHLVEIPFTKFGYRGDYQPVGGIDHVLNLTRMWGYAFTMPVGQPGAFDIDDVAVYGVAGGAPAARIRTDAPVYATDPGGSVTARIIVSATGGGALDEPVTVRYATGAGSATPGTDYTPVSGTVTFPAGTPSGTSTQVTVVIPGNDAPSTAKTIPVTLAVDNAVVAEAPTIVINAHGLPYLNPALPVEQRVADLLGRMSTDEKVGQMTQAERAALASQGDIGADYLGSLLSGGGSVPTPNTPEAWADMVDSYQLRAQVTPLQIPLIYGVDAVHGHNNVIGATIMPHQTGLGATRDPALVEKVGVVTATEVRATGVPWDFAPCLCVSRDERWGRAYESFGEDPALVGLLTTMVDGLQNNGDLTANTSVLATAKHFVADGGTKYGTGSSGYKIDQGVFVGTRDELWAVHIAPYLDAIAKGVGTVMPSYSSVDFIGDDAGPVKMHGNAELLTTVLKGQLGFDGFVISDYAGIDQLPGNYASDVRTSINAGLDMIMVPNQYPTFIATLKAEIAAGRIPMSRIDDAVSRILRQKFRLGLFEKPYADRTHLGEVGSAAHRAVARQAAAQSQVLLKNAGGLLPLAKNSKIYVAGGSADSLGNQMGGWSLTWQGSSDADTPGTTILAGMKQVAPDAQITYSRDASAPTTGYDVGVVVVGETPYAEGPGDVGGGTYTMKLTAPDRAAVDKVCGVMACVVIVVSGRPMIVTDQWPEMNALVEAWLPGTEGAGVADTLFGDRPYTGRLPVTWPASLDQLPINVGDAAYAPLYPYGWGLRTDNGQARLAAVRDQLAKITNDGQVQAAVEHLNNAIKLGDWTPDGTAHAARDVLFWLDLVTKDLENTGADTFAQYDAVVSVARDFAQQAAVNAGPAMVTQVASLIADADHAVITNHPNQAVALLAQAYRTATGS